MSRGVPPGGQELQHCKHTLIGEDVDGAVSGISGGERRRVSVGIGLVTDAHAIFLDEPTTGLDSDSAEALISLLSHLAVVKRRTVRGRACHQSTRRHSRLLAVMRAPALRYACMEMLYRGSLLVSRPVHLQRIYELAACEDKQLRGGGQAVHYLQGPPPCIRASLGAAVSRHACAGSADHVHHPPAEQRHLREL